MVTDPHRRRPLADTGPRGAVERAVESHGYMHCSYIDMCPAIGWEKRGWTGAKWPNVPSRRGPFVLCGEDTAYFKE